MKPVDAVEKRNFLEDTFESLRALSAEELLDRKKFDKVQELRDAMTARVKRNAGTDPPRLALSMTNSLMSAIWQIDATVASMIMIGCPAEPLGTAGAESCRRQLARIEHALAAAAAADGNVDLAASASPASIDAFLSHFDSTWGAFADPIVAAADGLDVGFDLKEIVLRRILIDLCAGAKWAMVGLMRHKLLRMPSPLAASLIDLEAMVRARIAWKHGPMGEQRGTELRVDAGEAMILGDVGSTGAAIDALIQNAFLFSDDPKPIRISVTTDRKTVALFFDDDGEGFREISIADSVKPFVRAATQKSPDASQCRLGLGLANVEMIARRSGWSLDFAEGKNGLRPILLFPRR
jgi:signal transduction histidine kinase